MRKMTILLTRQNGKLHQVYQSRFFFYLAMVHLMTNTDTVLKETLPFGLGGRDDEWTDGGGYRCLSMLTGIRSYFSVEL